MSEANTIASEIRPWYIKYISGLIYAELIIRRRVYVVLKMARGPSTSILPDNKQQVNTPKIPIGSYEPIQKKSPICTQTGRILA